MSKVLNNEDLEFIQRFFDYELSEKELETFDKRVETDSDFRIGVERFQKATIITDLINRKEKSPTIEPIVKPKIGLKRIFLLLISAIAILGIGFYFLKQKANPNTDSSEKIYASVDKYVTNMSNNAVRGNDKEIDITLLSPVELTIRKIKALNQDDDGISVNELELLLAEANQDDSKEILYWWLVKVNLNHQNIDAAKANLKSIMNNPNFNSSSKAKKILDEI